MANPTAKREHAQVAKDTANYLDLMPVRKSSLNMNIIRMMPIFSYPIPGERAAITTPSILRLGPKALGLNMFATLKENHGTSCDTGIYAHNANKALVQAIVYG